MENIIKQKKDEKEIILKKSSIMMVNDMITVQPQKEKDAGQESNSESHRIKTVPDLYKISQCVSESPYTQTSAVNFQDFCCRICQKSFKTATKLQEHAKIHRGQRPYPLLPKSFVKVGRVRDRYIRHIHHNVKHDKKEPKTQHTYTCILPNCGKKFSKRWMLNQHAKKSHGTNEYKCLTCKVAYAYPSYLHQHNQSWGHHFKMVQHQQDNAATNQHQKSHQPETKQNSNRIESHEMDDNLPISEIETEQEIVEKEEADYNNNYGQNYDDKKGIKDSNSDGTRGPRKELLTDTRTSPHQCPDCHRRFETVELLVKHYFNKSRLPDLIRIY